MNIVKIHTTFHSSIDQVWELMTDLNKQLWRSDVDHIEMIDHHRFIEYDKGGIKTEFVVLNKIRNDVYEFNFMNVNIEGHFIGKLKILDNGDTYLEMIEAVEPKKKILKLTLKKYLQKQQNLYIQDLKKALGEQ